MNFFSVCTAYVWSEWVKLTKSQYFFGLIMYVAKGGGGANVCSNEAYDRSVQTWQKKKVNDKSCPVCDSMLCIK